MAGENDFTLGAVYDFTTYASGILGTFKSVRVRSIVDYQLAQTFIDPAAMHASVYGSLPANSAPDDYRRYHYLVLEQPNGKKTALGLPWIDAASIILKDQNRISIVLEDVGVGDMSNIRDLLQINGYKIATLELDE